MRGQVLTGCAGHTLRAVSAGTTVPAHAQQPGRTPDTAVSTHTTDRAGRPADVGNAGNGGNGGASANGAGAPAAPAEAAC